MGVPFSWDRRDSWNFVDLATQLVENSYMIMVLDALPFCTR